MINFYNLLNQSDNLFQVISVKDMWQTVSRMISACPSDIPLSQVLISVRVYLVLSAHKFDYDNWISASSIGKISPQNEICSKKVEQYLSAETMTNWVAVMTSMPEYIQWGYINSAPSYVQVIIMDAPEILSVAAGWRKIESAHQTEGIEEVLSDAQYKLKNRTALEDDLLALEIIQLWSSRNCIDEQCRQANSQLLNPEEVNPKIARVKNSLDNTKLKLPDIQKNSPSETAN